MRRVALNALFSVNVFIEASARSRDLLAEGLSLHNAGIAALAETIPARAMEVSLRNAADDGPAREGFSG
jgi:hypothetical protein